VVEGKYMTAMEDCSQAMKIWQQVLLKELGFEQEQLELDEEKLLLHAVAYENKIPVAAGTIEYGDSAFLIRNIAVLPDKRRQSYGDFVLRMLVNKAVLAGGMPLRAEVTTNAGPLFEEVGFSKCGTEYEKNDITFCPYELALEAIHHCCECN
jgi:N-acetylglutamate synthase-like GNAT family acetyltransferase